MDRKLETSARLFCTRWFTSPSRNSRCFSSASFSSTRLSSSLFRSRIRRVCHTFWMATACRSAASISGTLQRLALPRTVSRRASAGRDHFVAANDRDAVRSEHVPHLGEMLRKGGVEGAFPQQELDDPVLEGPQADALAVGIRVLPRLDLACKRGRKGATGSPHVERQPARLGIVASDEAPQNAVLDDGEGRRGGDVHVLEVLDVDWRYPAETAVAHVEWIVSGTRRPNRGGPIMNIGDDADQVAHVEGSRLGRDVACRKVMVHERVLARRGILCDHFPGIVLQKAVDHHPVVTRQPPKLAGSRRHQSRHVAGLVEILGRHFDHR